MVRPMSEMEMQKWMEKSEKAHRNVEKHLDKQIERIFGKNEKDEIHSGGINSFKKRIFNHQNNNNNGGETMSKSFSDSLPSRSIALEEQWNEEAQVTDNQSKYHFICSRLPINYYL